MSILVTPLGSEESGDELIPSLWSATLPPPRDAPTGSQEGQLEERKVVAVHQNGIDPGLRLEMAVSHVDPVSDVGSAGKVSLIIPTRNEAANVSWVLEQVPECVDEIILVDGRSSDATVVTALSVRPDIRVVHQEGSGKGDAMRAGFLAATGDVLVAIDADGSMSPKEIPNFLHFLSHGYDFVKGSRFMGGGSSTDITWMRRSGNKALLRLVNHLHHAPLTDLCYGYFAFHRRYLAFLDLSRAGFEVETQLTISALQAGLRIAEVPSTETPRRHGVSNLRTFRDGTRVLRTVLRSHEAGVSGYAVQGLRRAVHRNDDDAVRSTASPARV